MANKDAKKIKDPHKEDEKSSGDLYDILRYINQAAANAWDGSHDKRLQPDGKEPTKTGLKREEGDVFIDSRIADGFRVKVKKNILTLSYQTEISSKDFSNKDIKKETEDVLNDIVKYLKKEYKSLCGKSLSLKEKDDVNILMQSMSSVRHTLNATKTYEIGGIEVEDEKQHFKDHQKRFKDYIKSLKD